MESFLNGTVKITVVRALQDCHKKRDSKYSIWFFYYLPLKLLVDPSMFNLIDNY